MRKRIRERSINEIIFFVWKLNARCWFASATVFVICCFCEQSLEYLIVAHFQSLFNLRALRIIQTSTDFVDSRSFHVIGKMLFIILFILAQPILLFIFFRTTKDFPKSWYEFKCEIKTILCGLRSQNEDLFLRRRNRISKFSLPWSPRSR